MSPRVSTFIYSDDSVMEEMPIGQRLHVINPQQVLRPAFVPGMYSFSVSFGIIALDMAVEHNLRVAMTSPRNKQIMDSANMVVPTNTDFDLPPELQGFMMNMNVRNVVFEEEGLHQTSLWLDDVCLGDFPIYVKAARVSL